MSKTLTVEEAAQLLNISERALRQRIWRGQFPHRRWGGKVVILRSELDDFLARLPGLRLEEIEVSG